jgi:hypothetical protein
MSHNPIDFHAHDIDDTLSILILSIIEINK